jgi:hypothetical protein
LRASRDGRERDLADVEIVVLAEAVRVRVDVLAPPVDVLEDAARGGGSQKGAQQAIGKKQNVLVEVVLAAAAGAVTRGGGLLLYRQ